MTDVLEEVAPGSTTHVEAGYTYRHFPVVQMAAGCAPATVECLLCLTPRDGYPTRLYFATRVTRPGVSPNWNGQAHVLGRNWEAYSWNYVPNDQHVLVILDAHLAAFRV